MNFCTIMSSAFKFSHFSRTTLLVNLTAVLLVRTLNIEQNGRPLKLINNPVVN